MGIPIVYAFEDQCHFPWVIRQYKDQGEVR